MKDGFLKVGAASPDVIVADCEHNAENIIAAMGKAAAAGVRLLLLPELCVTGSTCGDLFYQSELISSAWRALLKIQEASEKYDMLTIAGLPVYESGRLYNCAAALLRGKLVSLIPKKTSDRHFSAGEKDIILSCGNFPEFTVGFEGSGASILIAPYTGFELAGSAEKRVMYAKVASESSLCAYIAAGAGSNESTMDAVCGGHNIIAEKGKLLAESRFSDGIITADIDLSGIAYIRRKSGFSENPACDTAHFTLSERETPLARDFRRQPFVPEGTRLRGRREEIFEIQSRGLCKRMRHTGAKRLIVGVSGGLDSALALLASVRAVKTIGLPESAVLAVTMPCFGTTERTKSNAVKLCELLGTELRCIDISDSVRRHFADIGHDENARDVVYENSQARERTQVLMDIANAENGLVVGTGDLSELALGWATYNGDHMSMYGVNASVPKTLIRAMIRDLADQFEIGGLAEVLRDIAATPVSPELLPSEDGSISQKTEELIGSYELNDFLLYYTLGRGYSPRKLLRAAEKTFPEYGRPALVRSMKLFYGRFFSQQYKRSCMPDGPKTGTVSLSPRGDFMMPDDASAAAWLGELEAL